MKSKPLALLLTYLGVTKTHSRPRVSNDNPYSESQFKTLKYRPDIPDRFGSPTIAYGDARSWVGSFFDWYNLEHFHSSLALLTPASVRYGLPTVQMELRQRVLDDAFSANPERFVIKPSSVQPLPGAVWINRPQPVLEVGEEPPVGV
jgi:putative transposase